MNQEALKALQAPLKAQYKTDPDAAVVTLRAEANGAEGIACKVDTGLALLEAGFEGASCHSQPRGFATACIRAGVNIVSLKTLMNHASIQ